METTTDTLFPMPEAAPTMWDTWERRTEKFIEMAQAKGGFLPLSAVHDILGVSRQRVHQLVQANRLEKIRYFGQVFVTGRSIREYQAEENVTGRGHKKIGPWKGVVIGAKIGAAMASFMDD